MRRPLHIAKLLSATNRDMGLPVARMTRSRPDAGEQHNRNTEKRAHPFAGGKLIREGADSLVAKVFNSIFVEPMRLSQL